MVTLEQILAMMSGNTPRNYKIANADQARANAMRQSGYLPSNMTMYEQGDLSPAAMNQSLDDYVANLYAKAEVTGDPRAMEELARLQGLYSKGLLY